MSAGSEVLATSTIPQAFLQTTQNQAHHVALRWKDGDGWLEWTWRDYRDLVARAVGFLVERGVKRGDRVVLMMRNRPEFHVLDIAVLMCGATPISIYNSSATDQIAYLVGHCEATLGIVEDEGYLARFAQVRSELPKLKAVGTLAAVEGADFNWSDVMAAEPADLDPLAAQATSDDLATIIYTSGTTGPPKGVMITTANVMFVVTALKEVMGRDDLSDKRLVSYLPMAHIAERTVSHYQHLAFGYEVTTCPEPGKVAAYCAEVRPHVMFGVPRVWEKFHAGVMGALAADPDKAQKFAEGVEVARPIAQRRAWGEATAEDEATWEFLDAVAFRQVRELLGLDQIELAISGAAPIPGELLSWFRAIGVPMSEVYGMSENTGAMTWEPYRIKPGTVGRAMPGTEVHIAEDGEVLCRGPHVFAGYLNDPEKTAEAIDEDGWLHSGDIGEIDDDGYLRIVDRKKELIITAGGKNISPANLEGALKAITLVGQAAAIGDQRPFVSALVVLDPDTAPVWARQHGIAFETTADLAESPEVIAEIDRQLAEVMADFNNAERVKKVKVLGEEWLPDSDLLTPTSKLKRRGVAARFAEEIDALYA